MTRLYFIMSLVLIGHVICAQSVEERPLEFKIVKINDRHSNKSSAGLGSIIFYTSTIKWIQKPNSKVYEFEIKGIEGAWSEEGDAAKIYRVNLQNKSGTVILRRSSTIVTVEFLFQEGNKVIFPYEFLVSTVTQQ